MYTIETVGTRITLNGEEVGIMELNKQKEIMRRMCFNRGYQRLQSPSLRIYTTLFNSIRSISRLPAMSNSCGRLMQ
jgi:hypothetical protein